MNVAAGEAEAARLVDQKRYDEAFHLLQELSEHGSPYARLALGWMYEQGTLGQPDMNAAKDCYEGAASAAYPEAYLRLGRLLRDQGELDQARKAFESGAAMGNLGSMYRLGKMLLDGVAGPENVTQGVSWLEHAARKGHIYAQREVIQLKVQNSKSLIEKLLLLPLIMRTKINGIREIRRDMYSDKVS